MEINPININSKQTLTAGATYKSSTSYIHLSDRFILKSSNKRSELRGGGVGLNGQIIKIKISKWANANNAAKWRPQQDIHERQSARVAVIEKFKCFWIIYEHYGTFHCEPRLKVKISLAIFLLISFNSPFISYLLIYKAFAQFNESRCNKKKLVRMQLWQY